MDRGGRDRGYGFIFLYKILIILKYNLYYDLNSLPSFICMDCLITDCTFRNNTGLQNGGCIYLTTAYNLVF